VRADRHIEPIVVLLALASGGMPIDTRIARQTVVSFAGAGVGIELSDEAFLLDHGLHGRRRYSSAERASSAAG